MPSPITVGLNLSHQHSPGNMNQNIVAGSNYQANPAVIDTKLDPTISHCVPSSTFLYISFAHICQQSKADKKGSIFILC